MYKWMISWPNILQNAVTGYTFLLSIIYWSLKSAFNKNLRVWTAEQSFIKRSRLAHYLKREPCIRTEEHTSVFCKCLLLWFTLCLHDVALSSRTTFNPLDYLTGKGSAQDFNRLAASIGSNIQKISKNGESLHTFKLSVL